MGQVDLAVNGNFAYCPIVETAVFLICTACRIYILLTNNSKLTHEGFVLTGKVLELVKLQDFNDNVSTCLSSNAFNAGIDEGIGSMFVSAISKIPTHLFLPAPLAA